MLKKLLLLSFVFLFLTSCSKNEKITLVSSTGRINHLLIVMNNSDWQGEIGDTLREIIAKPVVGLPQEEAQFSINQVGPETFNNLFKRTRNILFVGIDDERKFYTNNNVYSDPQTTLTILGNNKEDLIENINSHKKEIISTFKNNDLKVYQKNLLKDVWNTKNIETFNKLGFSLEIPTQYIKAEDDGKLVWYRHHFSKGQLNILAYEIPNSTKKDLNIHNITKIKDSIGKTHMPGQFENTYMISEPQFEPITKNLKFKGLPALESRGLWIVKNDFMGGPYLSYALFDASKNRIIIIEGFSYSPATKKRDFVFELEAILKTFQIR